MLMCEPWQLSDKNNKNSNEGKEKSQFQSELPFTNFIRHSVQLDLKSREPSEKF